LSSGLIHLHTHLQRESPCIPRMLRTLTGITSPVEVKLLKDVHRVQPQPSNGQSFLYVTSRENRCKRLSKDWGLRWLDLSHLCDRCRWPSGVAFVVGWPEGQTTRRKGLRPSRPGRWAIDYVPRSLGCTPPSIWELCVNTKKSLMNWIEQLSSPNSVWQKGQKAHTHASQSRHTPSAPLFHKNTEAQRKKNSKLSFNFNPYLPWQSIGHGWLGALEWTSEKKVSS
jgi:hypothetical protein